MGLFAFLLNNFLIFTQIIFFNSNHINYHIKFPSFGSKLFFLV